MICADIEKLLKRFQDDLLLEEEYQEFLAHVLGCPKCREYVFSVGSLSTQLWELGQVIAPDDLAATVIFKLKHPPVVEPAGFQFPSWSRILREGFCFLIMLVISIGVYHFFVGGRSGKMPGVDHASVAQEQDVSPPLEEESPMLSPGETLLEDIQSVVSPETPAAVEVYSNKIIYAFPKGETAAVETGPSLPLHWHLRLSPEGSDAGQREKIAGLEAGLRLKTAELKVLESEIKLFPQESSTFRQHYSEASSAVVPTLSTQEKILGSKLSEKKRLESEIQQLKQSRQQEEIVFQAQQSKGRQEGLQRKAQLLAIFRELELSSEYDRHNLCIFNAPGDKVVRALERILAEDEERSSFRDLSAAKQTLAKNNYRVYLYLDSQEWPDQHWDIVQTPSVKKGEIMAAIKEFVSASDYFSEACQVLYGSVSQMEGLRKRMEAMRVTVIESGSPPREEDVRTSKPVAVSLCFVEQ